MWAFLWVDRWEPEPPRTLLFAFLWGACVAALSALIINSSAVLVADAVLGQGSGDVLGASVIAPIVEEGVKGAFVVGLLIFRRREFDGIVDGIVYAGLVGAGFAFTENILYMGRAFAESGGLVGQDGGVLAVLILRGVLSPFAHPLFTSMIGIGCGLAARQPHRRRPACCTCWSDMRWRWCCTRSGTARPPSAAARRSWGSTSSSWCRCSLAMIGLVTWQRRREQRSVAEQLPAFAMAGWIAPSEVALLSTLAGRNRWRRAVRQRSGKGAEKAVIRVPDGRHRAGVPARPDEPRGGRPARLGVARRAAVRPGRRAAAGDGTAGGAHRGLAASAALGLGAAAPAGARLAPEPVTAARLERRAAGWPGARRPAGATGARHEAEPHSASMV